MPKKPAPMKKKPKSPPGSSSVRPNAVKKFLQKYSQGMR